MSHHHGPKRVDVGGRIVYHEDPSIVCPRGQSPRGQALPFSEGLVPMIISNLRIILINRDRQAILARCSATRCVR